VRKKRQRVGRSPKTGVEVQIAPRRVIVFKPSAILKRQINRQPSDEAVAFAEPHSTAVAR
jgi:integration host factor subunit alpha